MSGEVDSVGIFIESEKRNRLGFLGVNLVFCLGVMDKLALLFGFYFLKCHIMREMVILPLLLYNLPLTRHQKWSL